MDLNLSRCLFTQVSREPGSHLYQIILHDRGIYTNPVFCLSHNWPGSALITGQYLPIGQSLLLSSPSRDRKEK